jgi:aspartate/methionine/tyrosine aminotransferase
MSENQIQKALQKRKKLRKPIINLSYPDFTFYPSLFEEKKIQRGFVNLFKYPYYYPTAQGDQETRNLISNFYKTKKQSVPAEHIFVCATPNEALSYLFKIFGIKGGEIICPTPCSPLIDEVAAFVGAKIINFHLSPKNNWEIDLKKLTEKITAKTAAIFLQNPHLPTGKVFKAKQLGELLKLTAQHQIAIICDESLSEFYYAKENFPSLNSFTGSKNLLITINSLANSFALPGAKISWITMQGEEKTVDEYLCGIEYLADTFLNLNQLSISILPELLKYGRKWRKKFQKRLRINRQILIKTLAKAKNLKLIKPEGGFYGMIEILKTKSLGEKLSIKLINETGLYLHPADFYGLPESAYLMICFLQDPKVLRRGLKRLLKFLKKNS